MFYEDKISDYLSLEELSSLPNLELQARYLAEGIENGIHRSPFRGSNVEFKEHRKYANGDRISDIDWKAYARTDRLHVRLREEDTNLATYFVLDRSASMDFKSDKAALTKYRFAQIVTAAMLLYLSRQHDASALTLLGETLSEMPRPSSSSHKLLHTLSLLSTEPTDKNADWEELAGDFARNVRSRSLIVVISDFTIDPVRLHPLIEALRQKKCELLFFHVFDPAERDFYDESTIKFEEMETGNRMILTPELIKDDYRKLFREHTIALSNLVTPTGSYLPLVTDQLPLKVFGAWIKQREKERRRR
ncbi:MAG: DUF58 domain-containing protein [Victivallales bacterium]|jgi:uncharacterized protein (DUF58 family)|nr:DUF58 domain-containing protein [Victivallales bacterium]